MERSGKRIRVAQIAGKGSASKRKYARAPIRRSAAIARGGPRGYYPAPRYSAQGLSLSRQVRALVASKRRDSVMVDRNVNHVATTARCLTSTTVSGTAALGTGIIMADADEVLINSIHMRGLLEIAAVLDLDVSNATNSYVRKIVVWFDKPNLLPSAAGTLPPITEVLVSDSLRSMYIVKEEQSAKFTILSDRTWNLGCNTFQAVTAVGHARGASKENSVMYDYKIKVGKMQKYAKPAGLDGNFAGGHYDSDEQKGQVVRGLIVEYCLAMGTQYSADFCHTRVNYTG